MPLFGKPAYYWNSDNLTLSRLSYMVQIQEDKIEKLKMYSKETLLMIDPRFQNYTWALSLEKAWMCVV